MPLRPGETFGRYQLLEPLGHGAMGEVYSAYDTVLHRKVALKVLTAPSGALREGPPSTKGAARILREARAAAGISHPNAVSIFDVGEVDGVSFLAMELVAGRTLRSFIGQPSVPLARRIRWIVDVARALGAAHALGLVHRDIKPENVMVRDDGFVKVLDFGIARRAITSEEAAPSGPTDLAAIEKLAVTNGTLTADGVVLGTPMYMAPEQMRGEALDGRTDQFAWGVLAHEVLTGKLPWRGEGVTMLSQILSQEVGPLSDRTPEIPGPVDLVIRRAMSKSAEARYPEMEEIAEALEAYAASGAGAAARTDQVASAVRDPALAATEQLPTTSLGVLAASAGTETPTTKRSPAAKARSARSAGIVVALALMIGAVGVWGTRLLSRPKSVHEVSPDAAVVPDVPSQMSSNPDANAAYRAGLQALRDGTMAGALKHLGRAVELDPLFGAAQLRLALCDLLNNQVSVVSSAKLQGVHSAQASLGTRDRIVLEAFELVAPDPEDRSQSEHLLEEAVPAYPDDGELPFRLAQIYKGEGNPAQARKAIDIALSRDPRFAFAWRLKAQLQLQVDDVLGATESFGECLRVSPGATTCLVDLGTIQSNAGQCADSVKTMRQLIPLVPDANLPYLQLAKGLMGSGESIEAVRAALQQYWDSSPPAERPTAQAFTEASLAVLAGDFAAAERYYQETERLSASVTHDLFAFTVAYDRVLIAVETGRRTDVRRIAEAYLRRRAGLAYRTYDFSLTMAAAEMTAGVLAPADFAQLRDSWNAQNQATVAPFRWIDSYALTAQTAIDAAAALATKPDVHPFVNLLFRTPNYGEPVGRVYALAGDFDGAMPYLTQMSASCEALDGRQAIFSTWAAFDLGRALEEHGEIAPACAAYSRVMARWGRARPPSRTAMRALARTKALGCAP